MNSYCNTFFLANSSIKHVYLISNQAQAVNALPLSSMAPIKSLPKHYLPLVYPTILLRGSDYVGHSMEQIPIKDKNLQKLHRLLLSAQSALLNPTDLK